MADGSGKSVLLRKTEAGRTSVAASRQITPCKALSSAIVHMAESRLGLAATISTCSARTGTLAELLDTVPEGGLLGVLEGPGDAQGLMVLDAAFLSAVIEKMMTGRLGTRPATPRRPTRTDAALTADLIDDILRQFETPFLGLSPARWAAGFGYSAYLDDPRPLGLMLEDLDYRMISVSLDLEGGARKCALLLALPAEGRGPLGRPPEGANSTTPRPDPVPEEEAVPWSEALEAQVMAGHTRLTAVLHRMQIPISALETLQPGLELPVPASAIDETTLVATDGSVAARGRLGQSQGKRALRLGGAPQVQSDQPEQSEDVAPARPAARRPAASFAAAMADAHAPPLPDIPSSPSAEALPDLPDLGNLPDLADGTAGDALAELPPLPALPDLA